MLGLFNKPIGEFSLFIGIQIIPYKLQMSSSILIVVWFSSWDSILYAYEHLLQNCVYIFLRIKWLCQLLIEQ